MQLARIIVYPIKSLDGLAVGEARILPSGALEHDRRFAICDASGQFINGKRTDAVHRLQTHCDPVARTVCFRRKDDGPTAEFHIDGDRHELQRWLSEFFGMDVTLEENADGGFPDDTLLPGPTVVSTATLQTVASWFEGVTLDEARLRFRANLEIAGAEPFWEDRLYREEGEPVRFSIGAAQFEGMNPCARCVVPTRSAATGKRDPAFQKVFAANRRHTLPAWVERTRFDHFFRLAVNTRPSPAQPPDGARTIRVGDPVRMVADDGA
jgi:uncharacterized protein YcbX